ncbi:uncharacterized protein LOC129580814 isoform X2 [Paramacrobiotus metropolitanus]|uniref:uncharacterized protein LOC129580814 isoform X2 n=1 Tax=Paramacrobiotus metropolitanus TaxID=2943436 RepID=UPI0024460144|nr:uncharacterized protein LOC129580814 isoform X2 [Paramacrobiotus metropolitanus]
MEEPSAELRPTVDECEFISDEEFFSLSHLQQSYYLKTAPEEQVKRIKEKRAELDLQKKSQYCQKRSAKKKLDRKLAKEKIEKEKQCGIFENVAPFEKLFLHRSQHVHTAYAKKVSKYLVRIFKTDSEMLQKMYAAVATGDSLDTSCVACGDDLYIREMLESLSGIGPHPDCILQSLPRQTWLGLNATIHGIREISRISLEAGAEYILARKQCSDPIEELNAAIKFGTTKLTAATVRQNISHIEAYQQLTESPNVGSRYKTRKRIIEISDEPLPKRQRTSRHPLRDYCFSFSNELEIIRDPEPCPVEDRTEKLMREDRKLWICSEMLQIVLCPWETLDDTNTDAGLAGLFNNAIADVTAALARTADQKSKCDSCRGQLVEVFSSGSELPGAAYVGARSRAEYGGLCLPRKQAFTLCSRAYTLFIKVTEIPAFVKSKSHLAVILKLMLLKMNLSDFHPL